MYSFRPRHGQPSSGRINMTPMIDVTFLLLTFFMLASHFASAEKTPVDLPQPDLSQALNRQVPDKVIVNAGYTSTHEHPSLAVGLLPLTSLDHLADLLKRKAQANPQLKVILRADRRIPYGSIRKIIETISAQGLTRLEIAAVLNPS